MSFVKRFTLLVALLLGFAPRGFSQPPTITQPAQVEPYERAHIYAKASGFVSAVYVDIGDVVEKGDLLAELSIPEMEHEKLHQQALVDQAKSGVRQAEARVESARAEMAAAEARVDAATAGLARHEAEISLARSELNRITDLVRSRSLNAALQDEKQQQLRAAEAALLVTRAEIASAESVVQVEQSDLRQAEADLAYARSVVEVAESSLQRTMVLMEYSRITAPFSGQIIQRSIDPGDFVTSAVASKGEPLFSLNSIGRFRIVFDVPEASATKIRIGQPVELKVDSLVGETFRGSVRRTSGQLDSRTRTLRVEGELDPAEVLAVSETEPEHAVAGGSRLLRPGMFGMITVTLSPP